MTRNGRSGVWKKFSVSKLMTRRPIRLHLALVLETVNELGEPEEDRLVCSNDTTMAKAGARPNSLLEVVIDNVDY